MPQRSRRPAPASSGVALYVLIGINVAVYLAWQLSVDSPAWFAFMQDHFLLSAGRVADWRLWTLITSAFSHVSADHLLFNMIGLFVFGGDLQRLLGGRRLVGIYLVGAVVSGLAYLGYSWLTGDGGSALGASGSVMALAALFGAIFPRRTLLLGFFIPIPAAAAVVLYIVLDLIGAMSGGTNIAHAAHLGGVAYGLGYYFVVVRPRLRPRR